MGISGILGGLVTAAPAAARATAGFTQGQHEQEQTNLQQSLALLNAKRENDLAQSALALNGAHVKDFEGIANYRNQQAQKEAGDNRAWYEIVKSLSPNDELLKAGSTPGQMDPNISYGARGKELQDLDQKTKQATREGVQGYQMYQAMFPDSPIAQANLTPEQAAGMGGQANWAELAKGRMQMIHDDAQTARANAHDQMMLDRLAPRNANFVNPTTGEVSFTDENTAKARGLIKQTGSAGGGGGNQQQIQTRLDVALTGGQNALQRMQQYVAKHTKGGQLDLSMLQNAAAQASALPPHDLKNIAASTLGQGFMNSPDNAEAAQFIKDGRYLARYEQLLAPRGGSEGMAGQVAYLLNPGPHANTAQVKAAMQEAAAMFGKKGAIVQNMTEAQKAKFLEGLNALSSDDQTFDFAGTGRTLAPTVGAPTPPSTPVTPGTQAPSQTPPAPGGSTHVVTINGRQYRVPE